MIQFQTTYPAVACTIIHRFHLALLAAVVKHIQHVQNTDTSTILLQQLLLHIVFCHYHYQNYSRNFKLCSDGQKPAEVQKVVDNQLQNL